MRITAIVATVDRTTELQSCLAALLAQVHPPSQIIVVDQNADDRVSGITPKSTPTTTVLHLRAQRGLSHARNVALPHVTGEVVAWPDDDCTYPPEVLQRVSDVLEKFPHYGGVTGRSVDAFGRTSGGVFSATSGLVDLTDVWTKATSFTLFIRKEICDQVGAFDEELGLGAGTPFGSAEDTDYAIRVVLLGTPLYYFQDITVIHPDKRFPVTDEVCQRAESYGVGMTGVMVKHGYPYWALTRAVLRPLLGSGLAAARGDFRLGRMRWCAARGRARGLILGRRLQASSDTRKV